MPRALTLALLLSMTVLAACAAPSRMGMVKDPATGLQFGSAVSANLVLDASQFENRKLKLTTRNLSGDPAFYLDGFRRDLEAAYAAKGFEPVASDDFGLLIDVNVLYSGQMQSNLAQEFRFLGGAGGVIAGAELGGLTGAASGGLAGATFGTVLGSYATEDTYIVIAEVTVSITDRAARGTRSIRFGSDTKTEDGEGDSGFAPFRRQARVRASVFAGGSNTPQRAIAEEVRQRIVRIAADVI